MPDENTKRTRRTIPIDEKIAKQQEKVSIAKKKYEKALSDLKELEEKKTKAEREKYVDALINSNKTEEEIINFLNS